MLRTKTQQYKKERKDTRSRERRKEKEEGGEEKRKESTTKGTGRKPCTMTNMKTAFFSA